MKKCPNGHEVSDNVKFCPHCGAQVTRRRSKKTESHNNQNLSIAERIALGIAGFVAFVGLCGGFANSMWITVIASVCALTAVCAVFKGYIEKKYAWTIAICSFLAVFIAIGATAPDSDNKNDGVKIEKNHGGGDISQKKNIENTEAQPKEFFERGYEYNASYRVNRKDGYGLSANYKYRLKIYNDGTTEIAEEIRGDEFEGHPLEIKNCTIEKKTESYRDVAATWYEVKFGSDFLYVDTSGNIILLYENGNDKNIQEAVNSKDCRFGRFSKRKLDNTKKYVCKSCGKEYNPDKEAIVSEEYCYMDYPQKCNSCGKTYTVNTDHGACKGTCSRCYHRHQSVRIYEEATGRKIY